MDLEETPAERFEKAKWQRSRNIEADRKVRIFNEKVRVYGIDQQALDRQVEEKRRQNEKNELQRRAYDAQLLRNCQIACLLEQREENQRREIQMDLVNFWQQQHRTRQELDMMEAQERPPTPPVFEGEDLGYEERMQRQREQSREWLDQQQSEQAAERRRQMIEDYREEQTRLEMDRRALQLQNQEMQTRRAQAVATKKFNLAKTEQKRRQDSIDECNRLWTVDPTRGRWGVPGLFPGADLKAPPETLEQVLRFQKNQMEEKKRMELEKRRETDQQDRATLDAAHTALLIERKQAKLRRQMRRQLNSTNSQLAELQRQQRPSLERGHIDDSFYANFNTCSR